MSILTSKQGLAFEKVSNTSKSARTNMIGYEATVHLLLEMMVHEGVTFGKKRVVAKLKFCWLLGYHLFPTQLTCQLPPPTPVYTFVPKTRGNCNWPQNQDETEAALMVELVGDHGAPAGSVDCKQLTACRLAEWIGEAWMAVSGVVVEDEVKDSVAVFAPGGRERERERV